jgi:hypothetical protein
MHNLRIATPSNTTSSVTLRQSWVMRHACAAAYNGALRAVQRVCRLRTHSVA